MEKERLAFYAKPGILKSSVTPSVLYGSEGLEIEENGGF